MRWGLVWVVALAAGAGCSAFGAGGIGTATPEVTPAPVPTETPTATPGSTPSVAPGVSTTGVGDVGRLVDGHIRAVRNTSWVWRETSTVTQTYNNVTFNVTSNRTVWFASPQVYRHRSSLVDSRLPGSRRYRQFADGDVAYTIRYSPEMGWTDFRRDNASAVERKFVGFAVDPLQTYLVLDSAVISRVDVGTRQHYLVEGSRSVPVDHEAVAIYHVRALIRADEFVRQLNVTYTVDHPDVRVEGHYKFTYRRVGNATVERPDWVAAARNETAP